MPLGPTKQLVPPDTAREAVPQRRTRLVLLSAGAGVLLAILWSFHFVDTVIGENVADTLLGHPAKETALSGAGAALLFSLVSGLAGTFTACNIAMAASLGPLGQAGGSVRHDGAGVLRTLARPTGLLLAGMVAVSGTYGFVGVLLGERLPQLSTATVGGMPVRLIQSAVVFGIIGLVLIWLGLAAIGLVRDPFAAHPARRVVVFGALAGGFLIGRPYPMFNKLFHWAVDNGNPLFGAAAFVLQSIGNVVLVAVIFALIIMVTRGRAVRWLADPRRAAAVTGALLIALGVFTVVYWDLRLPARFGYGWFPMMPYN
ncbi:hypothetical protein Ait01nite_036450 [Actinoplanes italicus]|uniref:Cytochrome C biogenesis DsbD-like protein n=1 Tax=Actinoplanes italicus TaxID=113567 RepID=A0A2T0K8H8_9ACTN|nr:hypothetical protein [Actinoplanes italicus]PRX19385.1 hypothetical protein CLV67_110137 [Actinoplanes italicus]GIE30600.1 hypothetical protein Ait01nite_036450 [Actinoplanes italicus]